MGRASVQQVFEQEVSKAKIARLRQHHSGLLGIKKWDKKITYNLVNLATDPKTLAKMALASKASQSKKLAAASSAAVEEIVKENAS